MNEYVTRTVIGVITAGLIILIIPVMFFFIGRKAELQVTKREINRYFEFWCQGVVSKMLPPGILSELKGSVDRAISDPEQLKHDKYITTANNKLVRNTYIICGLASCFLVALGCWFAFTTRQHKSYIWFEALMGAFMFIIIEVMIVVILFKNYYPLDVNMVNKHILMRVL